jgi:hypothetical protein
MDADDEDGRSYFEIHAPAPGSCLRFLTVEWVIVRDGSTRLRVVRSSHSLDHAQALLPPGLDLIWTTPPDAMGTIQRWL